MNIKIDIKIFLFMLIFYFFNQVEIYALLIFFALVHEMGHLLAGILLGYEVNSIKVNPIGFSINFKEKLESYNEKILNGTRKDLEEIVIALAGPFTNLGILLLCNLIDIKYTNIFYANLILATFNLIPIYPLDGGRVFKSVGNIVVGIKKSWQITNWLTNVIMISLTIIFSVSIIYYKNIGLIFMSVYLWLIVIKENRIYERKSKIYKAIEKYGIKIQPKV